MKHYLSLLAISLMAAIGITAQPVIYATNKIHNVGDVIHYQSAKRTGIVLGNTGANQIWDYSALVDTTTIRYDSIISPANSPYGADFPNANYCQHIGYNTSSLEGYYYYTKTSSNLRVIGYKSTTLTINYRRPIYTPMPYPYSYDYFYFDSSRHILQSASSGAIDSNTVELDSVYVTGYGTLIMPGNRVYEDVLQIKSITTQRARLSTSSSTVLSYHKAGIPPSLLSTGINSSGGVSSVVYLKDYNAATTSQYTFNGDGDWSNPLNWVSGMLPPSSMNIGTEININPLTGGKCVVNIPITIPLGSKLNIEPNAKVIIPQGELRIQ